MTAIAVFPTLLPMVEKETSESLPVRHPEFASRLQTAMASSNVSVTDIKNRLKVSYEMARRYSLGQAMPRQEKMAALAEMVGSTPSFLAYGTGPKVEPPSLGRTRRIEVVGDEDELPGAIRVRRVQLRLSAGISGFAIDPIDEDDAPILLPKKLAEQRGYLRDKLVAIDIRGQSMEPSLYEGDTVVINTADTTPRDGEVFAINYEGEAVVKRMVKDIGFWWLVSDNPDQRRFPKKQCAGDMCIVIGRIVHKQSERI